MMFSAFISLVFFLAWLWEDVGELSERSFSVTVFGSKSRPGLDLAKHPATPFLLHQHQN